MKIKWKKCKQLCESLSSQIIKNHRPTQGGVIIAIGRGGFMPAVCISHLTGFRLEPLMWQTRDGYSDQQGFIPRLHDIYSKYDKQLFDFYIIDDINDSGKTFEQLAAITNQYNKTQVNRVFVKSVAMFQRHNSQFRCDYVGETVSTDEFLVFPWELSK